MNTLFPFGFPTPTAFYLTMYVGTWVVHAVFAGYVVAGTAYLAVASVRGADDNPLARTLRDWLPFAVGLAITAGVAPLLFLQVLYQRFHYTANLLLFHRWMAIVPVLIVGFYLLYLIKTRWFAARPFPVRVAVGLVAFGCFAFIGWSWTENHLLSLAEDRWVEQYAHPSPFFRTGELLPRLAVWFCGTFPILAAGLGWQLLADADDPNADLPGTRRTALLALGGLATTVAATSTYLSVLEPAARGTLLGSFGLVWVLIGVAGLVAQTVAWINLFLLKRLTTRWLIVASIGGIAMITGAAVAREAIRLTAIDVSTLYARHANAAKVGGLWTFVLFLVVNGGLVAYCLRLVRSSIPQGSQESVEGESVAAPEQWAHSPDR